MSESGKERVKDGYSLLFCFARPQSTRKRAHTKGSDGMVDEKEKGRLDAREAVQTVNIEGSCHVSRAAQVSNMSWEGR